MITDFIYDIKEVTTKVKVINHIEIKCDKCGKTLIVLKPFSNKDSSIFKVDYLCGSEDDTITYDTSKFEIVRRSSDIDFTTDNEDNNHPNFWWIYIKDIHRENEDVGYRNYQLICEDCFKDYIGTYVNFLDDRSADILNSRIIIRNPLDVINKDVIFSKKEVECIFNPYHTKEIYKS